MKGFMIQLDIQLLLECHGRDEQGGALTERCEIRAVQGVEQETLKCEIRHGTDFNWEMAVFPQNKVADIYECLVLRYAVIALFEVCIRIRYVPFFWCKAFNEFMINNSTFIICDRVGPIEERVAS